MAPLQSKGGSEYTCHFYCYMPCTVKKNFVAVILTAQNLNPGCSSPHHKKAKQADENNDGEKSENFVWYYCVFALNQSVIDMLDNASDIYCHFEWKLKGSKLKLLVKIFCGAAMRSQNSNFELSKLFL